MKIKHITSIAAMVALAFSQMGGCATTGGSPAQQAAIATTAANLVRVAAGAAASAYGGPVAGSLVSAGLDGLGAVLQAYVGNKIPANIATAAPGVAGVGPAIVSLINPNQKVSQADVAKVQQAAQIAQNLAKVVVVPAANEAP